MFIQMTILVQLHFNGLNHLPSDHIRGKLHHLLTDLVLGHLFILNQNFVLLTVGELRNAQIK